MQVKRVFQMPTHQTFQMKEVKKLLNSERNAGVELDPFPYPYEQDALKLLKEVKDESIDFGLYDPPYSQKQLFEMYDGLGVNLQSNANYFKLIDVEWNRVITPGGKVIKFGWNSKRISKGFEITRILIINHGGAHNDTIVTVQTKLQTTLQTNCTEGNSHD